MSGERSARPRLWVTLLLGVAASVALYLCGPWPELESVFRAAQLAPLELVPQVTEQGLQTLDAALSPKQAAQYQHYQLYDVPFALANALAVWAACRLATGSSRRLAFGLAAALFGFELIENAAIWLALAAPKPNLHFAQIAAGATAGKQLSLVGAMLLVAFGIVRRVLPRRRGHLASEPSPHP